MKPRRIPISIFTIHSCALFMLSKCTMVNYYYDMCETKTTNFGNCWITYIQLLHVVNSVFTEERFICVRFVDHIVMSACLSHPNNQPVLDISVVNDTDPTLCFCYLFTSQGSPFKAKPGLGRSYVPNEVGTFHREIL